MSDVIRIGARKSTLAKLQAYTVGIRIQETNPSISVSYHFQESAGDKDLTSPLWKMESKGVFTKDLQDSLFNNSIDLIVHSWKDLDLEIRHNTEVSSVCLREDQRDVLFLKKNTLAESYHSPIQEMNILTSSPRREYNLKSFLPKYLPNQFCNTKFQFISIRGNIQTRFKKFITRSDSSALIMAKAGIDRLLDYPFRIKGFGNRIDTLIPLVDRNEFDSVAYELNQYVLLCDWMILPLSENPNAPAQGSLAVEYLRSNHALRNIIQPIVDTPTSEASIREREILSNYGGGCHQKIGVSVLKKDWGDLEIIKGFTTYSEVLNTRRTIVDKPNQHKTYSVKEIWPLSNNIVNRKRENIPISEKEFESQIAHRDLFITRRESLNSDKIEQLKNNNFQRSEIKNSIANFNRVIWTAGTSTWESLAKQGIWVHGTTDSIGENENFNITKILNREPNFIKITHSNTMEDTNSLPILITYHSAIDTSNITKEDIKMIKICYWRSGSEFDTMTEEFPELLDCTHCCGLGSTYKYLLNKGLNPLPYFSYKDFVETILIEDHESTATNAN